MTALITQGLAWEKPLREILRLRNSAPPATKKSLPNPKVDDL